MCHSRVTLRKASFVGLMACAGLLLATAGPAAADVTGGAGTSVGYDLDEPNINQPCPGNPTSGQFPNGGYTLFVTDTGTYTGAAGNSVNPVVYVGTTNVTVTNSQSFYVSPIGTHTATSCLAPASVTVNATVTGSDNGGSVSCAGSGTMIRVQSAVSILFSADCTVKGNVVGNTSTAHGSAVQHVLTGTLVPCYFPPPFSFDPYNPNPVCTAPGAPQPGGIAPGSTYSGTYQVGGN
jgi:hypothetical protein